MEMIKPVMLIFLLAFCGCCTTDKRQYFEILVGNRSNAVLKSAIIHADGLRGDFGYMGKGSPQNLKGAGFCQVRFNDGFAIEWNEDGKIKKTTVNLKQYEPKKKQIKSLAFYYQGNDVWQVVARTDVGEGGSVVQP